MERRHNRHDPHCAVKGRPCVGPCRATVCTNPARLHWPWAGQATPPAGKNAVAAAVPGCALAMALASLGAGLWPPTDLWGRPSALV